MKNRSVAIAAALLFFTSVAVGFIMSYTARDSDARQVASSPALEVAAETVPAAEEEPGVEEHAPEPMPALSFDGQRAYEIVRVLSRDIGTRVQGSAQEKRAGAVMADLLRSYGCSSVYTQSFPLPDGTTSQNVIAVVQGNNPDFSLVIGGHIDSRSTTPGANDNASGAAVTVELARVFARNGSYPTLIFILFGAEEDHGEITPEHVNSHYGSRYYVATMPYFEKERLVGMISLDMVGYGNGLFARYMGIGPMKLVYMIHEFGNSNGFPLSTKQGGNLSDHEPFEKAGIPSVWLEYMINGSYDPFVHRAEDTWEHVSPKNLQFTGELVQRFIESLDYRKCIYLKGAKTG